MSELSVAEAYERYAEDLVRYAGLLVPRSTAPDVVADAFADLLRCSATAWSRARDPKAFLFGAVANRARMHHRQTARRRQREEQLVMARRRPVDTIVDDRRDEMAAAFATLSVQQRAVTYLTYWEDMTVAQVAETLGVRDGTVRRQLARARDRLRGVLS